MKLLGWMHWKLRENGNEPFKNFMIGNSCTCLSAQLLHDEQQYYPEPRYSSAHSRQHKICQKSPIEHKANAEEDVFEEEPSIMFSELFHGFLAIGTLGSEPIFVEPTPPKFAISFENVTEKDTELTGNELNLINNEIENFLEAKAEEVGYEASQRSSHVSIITLCGQHIEGMDAEDNMVVCPLQEYLFSSSIELPKTGVEVKKGKTSLGDLFKKNDEADEHFTKQSDEGGKQAKGTCGMHFMKKMLKKLHSSSKSSAASVSGDAADSVSTKRKLPKVLRMFYSKIHPEKPKKKLTKSQEHEIKNTSHDGGYHNGNVTFQNNDNKRRFPNAAMLKKEITALSLSHNRLSSSHSTANGEHWIKTDADYLVLEL